MHRCRSSCGTDSGSGARSKSNEVASRGGAPFDYLAGMANAEGWLALPAGARRVVSGIAPVLHARLVRRTP